MKLIKADSKVEEDRGGYIRKVLLEHDFEQHDAIRSTWAALVTIPPDGIAQAHFHENTTEIFYFMGEGVIGINEEKYEVDVGDLVLVEPNEAHWVKAQSEITPLRLLAFKFPNIPEDKTLVQ
ncbi:MAG: cupin domain-containing protein [Candidatus Sifarchaeia archaeon]|jgi:mannose-6-phosphate isomerase-like protein (cupin superfamily)